MSQGYYNGSGYNNGNYNNGYYPNGNYNGQYYNPNYRYNRNYPAYNRVNNRGGANNPNYRNNGNNNGNDNKGHNKKSNNTPLYIVIACLLLVVAGVTGLLFTPLGGGTDVKRTGDDEDPPVEEKKDQKIGDETYGYITVPSDYVKYNGSKAKNTIKYASKDRKYYVTMAYKSGSDAYNIARASLESIKKAGATEAKLAQITIEEREAYQLYAVTDTDTTVLALVIDDDEGVTHFITIEGPDGTNKIFGALETYTFE